MVAARGAKLNMKSTTKAAAQSKQKQLHRTEAEGGAGKRGAGGVKGNPPANLPEGRPGDARDQAADKTNHATLAQWTAQVRREDPTLARSLGLFSIQEMLLEDEHRQRDEFRAGLIKAAAYQGECETKAAQLIELICSGPIDIDRVRQWLSENEVTEWVLVNLVHAGAKIGVAASHRHAAAQKNAAPRAWVQDEWKKRTDRGQSKEAFARQASGLLKTAFKEMGPVTPRTIANRWLKGL